MSTIDYGLPCNIKGFFFKYEMIMDIIKRGGKPIMAILHSMNCWQIIQLKSAFQALTSVIICSYHNANIAKV